ncbi:sterol desaturase family protein [Pseudonocardia spinosispora]|uniref:sterol desaturase family protein n=1 Tax=Pseudonocardia spinosispora TaxID=103441 RepID=UPI00048CD69C|nr:sterol desaturase family protein [Pseudonocardia spinosispora]
MIRSVVRYGYVPFMLLGVNGSAIALASLGFGELCMVAVIVVAVLCSFGAERLLPYAPDWNVAQSDAGRDTAHSFVNESLILLSVAVLPALAAVNPLDGHWPSALPFVAQVLMSILVADLGITLVHLASHKVGWMWRFHSVHHSVTRFYGLNGLMKHPVHQSLEMAGGVLPLILLGIPVPVASVLATCVAVQLLLQHSNVDYSVGVLGRVLALNRGHRFHHLKWAGVGDVNFGLFTLIWDHLLGTYSFDPERRFVSADLGMAAEPNYPTRYFAQLAEPFRRSAS